MPAVILYAWDDTNKVYRKLVCNADGKLIIDPSEILEDTPTNGETGKAPTSNWAYDHEHDTSEHLSIMTTLGDIIRRGASAPERLPIGSNDQVLTVVSGQPAWAADAGGDAGEGHILILPWNYNSVGQGTWAITIDANCALGFNELNHPPADGDNISYKVYLAVATYTLRTLVHTGTNRGILDIDIDASEVASFDLYAGSNTYNVLKSQTGITIATSGLKTVRLRVDGKNASSSSYYAPFSSFALWRTA